MLVTLAARTNTGTVRTANQDAFAIGSSACFGGGDLSHERTVTLNAPLLIAVADGMGGHAAGERASEMLVRRLTETLPQSRETLEQTLGEVHRVLKTLGESAETHGLGTTFCGILLGENGVGACVGDGFVAVLAGRGLRPLGMSWDEIAASNELDAAIGGGNGSPAELTPKWFDVAMIDGARYVVASDGLVRALPYDECRAILTERRTPRETLARLFDAALSRGAPDNITCIVADLKGL